jgi:hypothetical protein
MRLQSRHRRSDVSRKKTFRVRREHEVLQLVPRHYARIALVILIVVITMFTLCAWAWSWYLLEWREVPVVVRVADDGLVGFSTDTDELDFGTLGPGNYAERKATLVTARDARVVATVYGDVSGWIAVNGPEKVWRGGVPGELVFRLTVPEGTAPGEYDGTVRISQYRAGAFDLTPQW